MSIVIIILNILAVLIPAIFLAWLILSYVLTESWSKTFWLMITNIKITCSKHAFIKEIQQAKLQSIQYDLKLIYYTDDAMINIANPTNYSVDELRQMANQLLVVPAAQLYSFDEAQYYLKSQIPSKYGIDELPRSKYQYLVKQLMHQQINIEMANQSISRINYLRTAIQKMINLESRSSH